MGFYVESADRPYISRLAAEDIDVGTLVAENGSDQYREADAQNDSVLSYLATEPQTAEHIADDEDAVAGPYGTYLSAENDRVPSLPLVDGDLVKVRTAEDAGGNESSPSISDGDVVGVIDTSAGTLTSSSEYQGRIVEEGYTDGESTPTTYNRSNSNFVALGTAERDESSSFDDPVRIRVKRDLN
jgi:hypothetical protein